GISCEEIKNTFFRNQAAHKKNKPCRQFHLLSKFSDMGANTLRLPRKPPIVDGVGRGHNVCRRSPQRSEIFKRSLARHDKSVTVADEISFQPLYLCPSSASVVTVAFRPQNKFDLVAARPQERLPRRSIRVSAADQNLGIHFV